MTFTVPLEEVCAATGVHAEIDGHDVTDTTPHHDDICITREDGETFIFAADMRVTIDEDGLATCTDVDGTLHEFSFRKLVPIERADLS